MPTVAEQLRQAREAHNLSIEQVADITKIRSDHVRAIENGDYQVFSAPVYVRGFVRTYAKLVKLDPVEVIASLDEELSQESRTAGGGSGPETRSSILDTITLLLSKIDWRKSLMALGAVGVMLGIVALVIAWRHYRKSDPLAGLKPGVYQSTQDVSGQTLPLPAPQKK